VSSVLDDWIDAVCEALGIGFDGDVDELLDVARVAAHDVERRAAPVTTYLMGMAVHARGGDAAAAEDVARTVVALARSWNAPGGRER
jgi:hypothetical protein